MKNLNSQEYIEESKGQLLEILRDVEPVPGTQIQTVQVESQLNPRSMEMEVEHPSPDEEDPERRLSREDTGRKEHASELAA